jgi:uncharacterized membrane protein YdbT with pleckstrin-like domain
MTENVYHNLGEKAYWCLVSKKTTPGFVFLLLALILSVLRAKGILPVQVLAAARTGSWAIFAIAILALVIAFITSRLEYKSSAFMLSPDALKLRRGVLRQGEFAIPYRQIQNIEIERSLSQRMLGLSRLEVETAGEETDPTEKGNAEGVLPSIDSAIAEALRDELLRRANIQKTVEVAPQSL